MPRSSSRSPVAQLARSAPTASKRKASAAPSGGSCCLRRCRRWPRRGPALRSDRAAPLLPGRCRSARGGLMSARALCRASRDAVPLRREVAHSHQQLHLTPRNSERQHCLLHRIDITPRAGGARRIPGCLRQSRHARGARSAARPPAGDRRDGRAAGRRCLSWISSEGESWEQRARSAVLQRAAARRPSGSRPCAFAASRRTCASSACSATSRAIASIPGASVLTRGRALMAKVHREFHLRTRGHRDRDAAAGGVCTSARGVCQDFAHLMIACLRSAGLAARYVSGYLHTRTSRAGTDEAESVPAVVGADASHAWVAVFAPPSAGSDSIRPTMCSSVRTTWRSPGAATSAMSRRCAA